MEDIDLLQSNSDDEVMVRQADGTFKKIKLSELNAPHTEKSKISLSAVSSMPDFDRQAEALVKRLAEDVTEDLRPRVKMLLVSYLKGIRQEYAVRERLLQSIESGGLGWTAVRADLFLKGMKAFGSEQVSRQSAPLPVKPSPAPQANKILNAPLVPEIAPNILPGLKPEVRVSKINEAPPKPPVVSQSKPAVAPYAIPLKPSEKPLPDKIELPKPELVKSKQPPAAPKTFIANPSVLRTSDGIRASAPQTLKIVEEKGGRPRVESQENAILPQKPPPHLAIPQTPTGKADMRDIAYKPRLVGPIEELHTLTLVDFRRLSRDPQVAADKIHAKVELLGEESFEKKIKGVLAWRVSEVNGLYVALLNESIKTGLPIKEIIGARVSRKETTLTTEEFKVIMNLNRQLRF